MDQERIFLLLARKVAGEATPEEQEELESAFIDNPELRRLAALLTELRPGPPKGIGSEEEQRMMERGLERIKGIKGIKPNGKGEDDVSSRVRVIPVVRRLGQEADAAMDGEREERKMEVTGVAPITGEPAWLSASVARRRWPVRWMAAAAVLILVVTGGLVYMRGARLVEGGKVQPIAILAAERGARKSAKLPDGSQLWLNAGSRIVLAEGFSRDKRELTLEGEAFFDVKHDEQHPFLIHTGALEVRVLGTTLNVRAYPGEASMETTLIEGKAEIGLAGNPQSAILLHPNEKVIIPNEATAPAPVSGGSPDSAKEAGLPVRFVRRAIVPDKTDGTIAETSWTKNRLVFRNETLAGMSMRLERWYAVKIVFDDNRYLRDTISGTFPDVPIGDVMHALQITSGFKYRIDKDTVHIW